MTRRQQWLAAGVVVACALLTVSAWARPGGGQSYSGGSHYSGGSSHYSGGGSSGGGGDASGLVFQLILLCFNYPAVGVPLLAIIVGFFIVKSLVGASQKEIGRAHV